MKQANTQRLETLNFVQSMLQQLNQMARNEQFDMLAYFIEMACVECGDQIYAERAAPIVPSLKVYDRNSAA